VNRPTEFLQFQADNAQVFLSISSLTFTTKDTELTMTTSTETMGPILQAIPKISVVFLIAVVYISAIICGRLLKRHRRLEHISFNY
jgi:hypothetical protein